LIVNFDLSILNLCVNWKKRRESKIETYAFYYVLSTMIYWSF